MTSTAEGVRKAREYQFTEADFLRVKSLVYDRAGIALSASKQDMVYTRLARCLRERGLSRFSDYLALLDNPDAPEWESFTNALTTNLTSFFREAHHFPILAEHLAARWKATRQPMTIWCCAASTGEEPYTIAMTVVEALQGDAKNVRILATDLDTEVLAKAQAGVYRNEQVRTLSPERLRRFFMRGSGAHAGQVKVRSELRQMITFKQLNLIDDRWPLRGPFEIMMCRNVMIYFDKATQRNILQKFAPLLDPNGLLFAGHSESFFHAADLFKLRGKTVYEPATKVRRA